MAFFKDWLKWLRALLGTSPGGDLAALEILRQRYVEEMQSIESFKHYADKMHYPQYRDKFLRMAQEKTQHADRIGAKIAALGGRLPDVAQHYSTDKNSWQSLSMALDEENRSADRLAEQLRRIESEHADIREFLQTIVDQEQQHRQEIRHMLMRSDAFALSLA